MCAGGRSALGSLDSYLHGRLESVPLVEPLYLMSTSSPDRRSFLKTAALGLVAAGTLPPTLATSAFAAGPDRGSSQEAPSIRTVIDAIIAEIGVEVPESTVDTVKSADPSVPVRGVATTFIATCGVIEQAIERNLNLIITHEPTFYNHRDETSWLEGDAVYAYKRNLLEENGIVVWRLHDLWHQWTPDPVTTEILNEIGWTEHTVEESAGFVSIEPVYLGRLARRIKHRLALPTVRVAGDPDRTVRRVGMLPGAMGGRRHIEFLGREDVDALLVGEVPTWQSPEYARDAAEAGRGRSIVEVGHQATEEAGMRYVVDWIDRRLRSVIGEVPVVHIPAGDPFFHV